MSRPFTLADVFEVAAGACPERLALVAGEVRLSYAALDERADRLGHALLQAGLQTGEHVAILSWNRAEWIEALLGAYKARLVPINVNYRYVEDELAHVLADSDAAALVVERAFLPRLAAIRDRLPDLRVVLVVEDGTDAALPTSALPYEPALAAADLSGGFPSRSGDDHYILYTGGTTGLPKGVVWRQEDLFFGAIGAGNPFAPPIDALEELADRITAQEAAGGYAQLILPPMMHGGGQWMSFITWCNGGNVVLWTERHLDPVTVWRVVERERAVMVGLVGDAMARPLVDELAAHPADYDVSSLAIVGSGGAILSPSTKDELRALLPGVYISDSFGASETGANGSVYDSEGPSAGPRFTMAEHTSVLDDELRPVAPGSGTIGRLARSGHIPLGYYHDDAKTAATFLTDPSGRRWVVPGDYATVDADGVVTLLGRGSVSINTGGEKVFPEEVESVLKAHSSVYDVVVVGVPDRRFGECVVAVVQPRANQEPTLEDLSAHCRAALAGYKVPRAVHLTTEVHRTPAGKPDYRWAKDYALQASHRPYATPSIP